MLKEPELIACPNPKCGHKIGDLIVVSDVSTIPVKRFYACPHCFFELDVISAQFLRKEEMRVHAKEEKEEIKSKPGVDAENEEGDIEEPAPSPPTPLEEIRDVILAETRKENEGAQVKPTEKTEKSASGCPHNFGYLANRPENVPFPQECLVCPKVLDCVMKSIHR